MVCARKSVAVMKWLKAKKLNRVVTALVVYAVVIVASLIAPQWTERILMPILMLPMYAILFFGLEIPNSIAAGGGLFLLSVVAGCFIPAFVLRRRIPEQVKIITKYWPLICFLMGMSYWGDWYNAFYLCMFPALVGLAIGKIVRHWQEIA